MIICGRNLEKWGVFMKRGKRGMMRTIAAFCSVVLLLEMGPAASLAETAENLAAQEAERGPASTTAVLLEEDQEMAVYSTEGRCMIFHTSALSPKTTRTTQGVNVMSLKPKYRVEKALPLAQTPIRNAARYRARSLPIAGALLREPDRGEEQMTLL